MNILGLNYGEINSSAALVVDGKVVAGAPEERFNRVKKTKAFPANAVKFCLESAGIQLEDCDAVAQAWNPGESWHKYNPLISGVRIRREDNFYAIPDNLLQLTTRKSVDWVAMTFPTQNSLPPIYHLTHHRSHAANAFFLSPFEEAAVLTADWRGEYESTTMGLGKGIRLDTIDIQKIPHSLGMFYSTFTELLGFRPDEDEWKVMALAAFDVGYRAQYSKIHETLRLGDGGALELDQSYYKGALLDQPNLYTQKLVDLLGGRIGKPEEQPEEWHYSVARAMQLVSEEIATHFLRHLYTRVQCDNLVVSGGYFMNSVYNGKVLDQTPFKDMYVSYAPADLGNSLGAALYLAHCVFEEPRDFSFHSSLIGPEFTDDRLEAALIRRNIAHEHLEDPATTVAKLLAKGEIVAFFNGRMEFGERALGNRSILADPRDHTVKDRINAAVKYREAFRPFAPAVLHDKCHEYFSVSEGFQAHYMEKVVLVRPEYRDQLPAITHMDGSARVQTVCKEHNPVFYDVIAKFGELTGYSVVLNTSFNTSGEPIVLSPDDGLNTFYNSGLKYLVMGSYLVRK